MNTSASIRTERLYDEATIEKVKLSVEIANIGKSNDIGYYIIDTTGKHQVYFTLYRYNPSTKSKSSPYKYIKNITSDFAKLEEVLMCLNSQPIPVIIASENNNDAKVCSFRNRLHEVEPVITFGKYQGKNIAEIWDMDRGYVVWFAKNFTPKKERDYKLVSAAKELTNIFYTERTEENRQTCTSNFIGQIGDKVTIDAKVINIKNNLEAGYTTIELVTDNGDLIYIYDKEFALQVSNVVTIKGTITKHIEKVGKKMTYINRVKVSTK